MPITVTYFNGAVFDHTFLCSVLFLNTYSVLNIFLKRSKHFFSPWCPNFSKYEDHKPTGIYFYFGRSCCFFAVIMVDLCPFFFFFFLIWLNLFFLHQCSISRWIYFWLAVMQKDTGELSYKKDPHYQCKIETIGKEKEIVNYNQNKYTGVCSNVKNQISQLQSVSQRKILYIFGVARKLQARFSLISLQWKYQVLFPCRIKDYVWVLQVDWHNHSSKNCCGID